MNKKVFDEFERDYLERLKNKAKPVSKKEMKSSKYNEGISCPKCHDHITHEQKSRFAMRQKQILLAKKSGKRHIFQKEF